LFIHYLSLNPRKNFLNYAMKRLLLLLLFPCTAIAQQIHAHNDYEKPVPFVEAYQQQAASIEADVFLVNNQLMVAHTKEEIRPGRTLDSLYILPIVRLFEQHKGKVSPDRRYTFQLMIDVKGESVASVKQLMETIAPYRQCFDRTMNPLAIQLVISGNRPPVATWVDYPPYIQFDGRPTEVYDKETLRHVALISDTFLSYSRWKGEGELPDAERDNLKRIIKRVKNQEKPVRFWNTPDTPLAWKQLSKLGVDYINTDRVRECAEVIR